MIPPEIPLSGDAFLEGANHEQYPEDFDVRMLVGRYPEYFDLLSVTPKPDDSMDAIIVPAARSVEHIEAAASLAKLTGTLLITLCSHNASSSRMATIFDDLSVPRWWAVDMPPGYTIPSVGLASAEEILPPARRINPSNLSDKRNVGVALGNMAGLQKIFFVDDDVVIGQELLHSASLMLTGHKVAGLRCGGFPDKAVVDHAETAIVRYHRSSAGIKSVKAGHISGNSVAVDVQRSEIFFPPEIYNEDLFAFYDLYSEGSAALVNGHYSQADFDPFADPDRARIEEFGEVLAHGLYQHLRQQHSVELTDSRYWAKVIAHRRWLIGYLLKGLDAPQKRENFSYFLRELPVLEPEKKEKIRNSLLAALSVHEVVTGTMCVNYYRSWRADQARWRGYLSRLQGGLMLRDAIDQLELASYATNEC
jgi:hypothetical protein